MTIISVTQAASTSLPAPPAAPWPSHVQGSESGPWPLSFVQSAPKIIMSVNKQVGNREGRRQPRKQMHEPQSRVFYENPSLWKVICEASGFRLAGTCREGLSQSLSRVTEKWLTRDCVHRLADSKCDLSHLFLS